MSETPDEFERKWIAAAVEIASVFQSGGALAGKLPLGSSTVHDGMRWLLAERERLLAIVAELEAARDSQ